MNCVLCGFHRAGKTTIGRACAQELGWKFFDTDHLLEERYALLKNSSLNCRKIYEKEGEEYFRALEHQVLLDLHPTSESIIATGGGSVLCQKNRSLIAELGSVIYLRRDPAILEKEIFNGDLPAFIDQSNPHPSFSKVYQKRSLFYEELAQYTIDIDHRSLPQVVEKLCQELRVFCCG